MISVKSDRLHRFVRHAVGASVFCFCLILLRSPLHCLWHDSVTLISTLLLTYVLRQEAVWLSGSSMPALSLLAFVIKYELIMSLTIYPEAHFWIDEYQIQYKYRNGLLPMQYVFLIRSSAGCKKYVTRHSQVTSRESVSNTRIAWARDRFYFYCLFTCDFEWNFTQKPWDSPLLRT